LFFSFGDTSAFFPSVPATAASNATRTSRSTRNPHVAARCALAHIAFASSCGLNVSATATIARESVAAARADGARRSLANPHHVFATFCELNAPISANAAGTRLSTMPQPSRPGSKPSVPSAHTRLETWCEPTRDSSERSSRQIPRSTPALGGSRTSADAYRNIVD
jgi:hypothetical protein